jgi:hypothetical protein
VLEVKVLMSVLVAAAATAFGSDVLGQEGDPPPRKEKTPVARRFFDHPIDYWGRGLEFEDDSKGSEKTEKSSEAKRVPKRPPSEWGQVVKLPDGTFSYHELPRPLVDVLENPSPENIRAYFAFRMDKTQKILRAAELMKVYRASVLGQTGEDGAPVPPVPSLPREPAGGPPERPLPSGQSREAVKPSPFTVTYFHKQHCPHCDSQDVILAEWLKDKPEGKLEVVEFGRMPELWRATQVRGTPTLLLQDSASKQMVLLEGLSRAELLDRKLGECRAKAPEDAAVKGRGQK